MIVDDERPARISNFEVGENAAVAGGYRLGHRLAIPIVFTTRSHA